MDIVSAVPRPVLAGDRVDVPISALEHFSYCPRQCALIHVEQTFDENQFTIRGRLAHERVDSGEDRSVRGVRSIRALALWSDRHGLVGRADVVELRPGGPFPIEYKVGRRRGDHADLQLCAQALCLEEMLDIDVPAGALYFREERRRYEVAFDADLRSRTLETVHRVREQLATQVVPDAVDDGRCPRCSLVNACLPSLVAGRRRRVLYAAELYRPLPRADEASARATRGGADDA